MTLTELFGYMYNIKAIQALRILEQSTAIAVLFAPEKVDDFVKELAGMKNTSINSATPSIHELAKSAAFREQIKRDLG